MVADSNAVYPNLKAATNYFFQRRIAVHRIFSMNVKVGF